MWAIQFKQPIINEYLDLAKQLSWIKTDVPSKFYDNLFISYTSTSILMLHVIHVILDFDKQTSTLCFGLRWWQQLVLQEIEYPSVNNFS